MEKIINYMIQKTTTPFVRKDTYKIKKPNKFKKFLIKWLLRLGIIENEVEQKVEFQRVRIDCEKVGKLIRTLHDEIYYTTGNEPRVVIIGLNKMRELEMEMYQDMRFDMPLELYGNQGRKIFGLDIILNPRIDGIVLI